MRTYSTSSTDNRSPGLHRMWTARLPQLSLPCFTHGLSGRTRLQRSIRRSCWPSSHGVHIVYGRQRPGSGPNKLLPNFHPLPAATLPLARRETTPCPIKLAFTADSTRVSDSVRVYARESPFRSPPAQLSVNRGSVVVEAFIEIWSHEGVACDRRLEDGAGPTPQNEEGDSWA